MDSKFLTYYGYEDLREFTDNFSDKNLIGTFEFGKIYIGFLPCSVLPRPPIVVKIWDSSEFEIHENGLRFMREITLLRNENINCLPGVVKLIGYVVDGEHLAVMYDRKPRGTICKLLDEDDFTWLRRIKVALWIARLLTVFHSQTPLSPLVLNKIDPAHILVNEDFVPNLCDFSWMTGGRIFPSSPESFIDTSQEMTGGLTPKSDVFGFGLLLWSLISKVVITGEAVQSVPKDVCWDPSNQNLVSLLNGNRKSSSFSLVHKSFEDDPKFNFSDGQNISSLVIECLHPSPKQRPSMNQAVKRLKKLTVCVDNRSFMTEILTF